MRLSALFLLCLVGACQAQPPAKPSAKTPAVTREHHAPNGWEDSYHQQHYSPVVRVGNTVIVSGIPAAVGDNYEGKVRWMFEQLRAHLATVGASMADVVELTSYHVTPKNSEQFREELKKFAPIHHEFFPDHYPAWSAVGTTALLADGAPVELRAVAMIGSGKAPKSFVPETIPAPKQPPP